MTPAALATLLQMLISLLSGLQNNPQASQATIQQTLAIASQAIQINAQVQAAPKIQFTVPKNNSIWPNITDLYNAAYLNPDGTYTQRGVGVDIVGEDTSFGDLNGDGFDDAAIVVQRTDTTGHTDFALAAMLNQGGVMFNVADLPLGKSVQVFSHHVIGGGIISLDMQIDNQPRAIYQYELIGIQFVKL